MDWQQLASLLIVAATVLAFCWRRLRSDQLPSACGSLCGGCSDSTPHPPQRLIFRGKKGERSTVIVKSG